MFYVTCNTCKEFWLTCKNRDSRQISSFSKKLGEIPTKFHQNLASKWQNSIKKCWKMKISLVISEKSLTIFDWNFEVWAVQKYANLVDRVKSFPTSIYLQKSASIQPRTSPSKFGGKIQFTIHFTPYARREQGPPEARQIGVHPRWVWSGLPGEDKDHWGLGVRWKKSAQRPWQGLHT